MLQSEKIGEGWKELGFLGISSTYRSQGLRGFRAAEDDFATWRNTSLWGGDPSLITSLSIDDVTVKMGGIHVLTNQRRNKTNKSAIFFIYFKLFLRDYLFFNSINL